MGWTFKLHGGFAAVLGSVLLVLTALTWLPGTLPLTGAKWPLAVIVVLLFPIFVSALVRALLARPHRDSLWPAFRCLPRKVQLGLGALVVSGFAMMVFSSTGDGHLQSAEVKEGRYFAMDSTPQAHRTVEVTRSQYQVVLESDQRMMFGIPGLLFVGAACVVLVAGELRRADRD
ncbi:MULTISPECIES: hypothetical protein [unclassified Streptomyces]|uniref:hypothetical protein n=1 Tax=unclassified Streptomyces TaxID=2593676 RepID=UPI002E299A8F|nr:MULTISPECIES: hypothetical protein [unclassified Streptomyces]